MRSADDSGILGVTIRHDYGNSRGSTRMSGNVTTTLRILILSSTLVSAAAAAQTDTTRGIELTLFGGQGFGGDFTTESELSIDLDSGSDSGFILDFDYDEETQWEFLYLQQDTSADTSQLSGLRPSIDTDIRYFHGGGTYLGDGDRVRPYIAGTAGVTHIEPHGEGTDSDTFWSISIGGGVRISASERVSFRLEGRVFGTFVNSESSIYCGSQVNGGQCLFALKSDVVWQSHALAGITIRF